MKPKPAGDTDGVALVSLVVNRARTCYVRCGALALPAYQKSARGAVTTSHFGILVIFCSGSWWCNSRFCCSVLTKRRQHLKFLEMVAGVSTEVRLYPKVVIKQTEKS
jgi:hypothetical protein